MWLQPSRFLPFNNAVGWPPSLPKHGRATPRTAAIRDAANSFMPEIQIAGGARSIANRASLPGRIGGDASYSAARCVGFRPHSLALAATSTFSAVAAFVQDEPVERPREEGGPALRRHFRHHVPRARRGEGGIA